MITGNSSVLNSSNGKDPVDNSQLIPDIKTEDPSEKYMDYSIEELEKMIETRKMEAKIFHNMEQSIKLMLNSIYGAFGNEWFYFYNLNIAETITIQSQDSILYIEKELNRYFKDLWFEDTETHEKMGIKLLRQNAKPAVIYIDTDSCYVSVEEALENSTWEGTEKEFIRTLYDLKLKNFIEESLEAYAKKRNTDNYLKFEMESMAKRAIWLAKKNYIQDLVWQDPDIHHVSLTNIKAKGYETVKSSTSQFGRKSLEHILKFIFSQEDLQMEHLVKMLREIRQAFKLENIENITKNLRISRYKYDSAFGDQTGVTGHIVDDEDKFEIRKGCPAHVRGAGYHNYLLHNSAYVNKYHKIQQRDKVKMYYSKDKNCDVFSFLPGDHPYQFAPPVDHDLQFEKTIIDPVNRVLKVLNLQTLDRNLIYASALF